MRSPFLLAAGLLCGAAVLGAIAYADIPSGDYELGRIDGVVQSVDALLDPTPEGCVGAEELAALRARANASPQCPFSAAELNAWRALLRISFGRCVSS